MNLTALNDITQEKRDGERMVPEEGPSSGPHCLKCGHAIEVSKHYGVVFIWEPRTEELHVCKRRR